MACYFYSKVGCKADVLGVCLSPKQNNWLSDLLTDYLIDGLTDQLTD